MMLATETVLTNNVLKKYVPMLALFHASTKLAKLNVVGNANGCMNISVFVLKDCINAHPRGNKASKAKKESAIYLMVFIKAVTNFNDLLILPPNFFYFGAGIFLVSWS